MNGISFFYGVVSGILIFGFTLAFNDYNLFGIGLSDAWIAFLGAIVGGIITITGVYFTLKQNRELMEESHNKQMKLMLTQIRTQFWMEKFSDAISYAENINKDITNFVKEFNEMDLSSRSEKTFNINYLRDKVDELDKHSYSIYPMLLVDENLKNTFNNFKHYILDLNFKVVSNFNFVHYNKINMDEITYDIQLYSYYFGNLMHYVINKEEL